jgi:NAD(P)-dependent dehydrogenase (short-subunit alcohol dehydrogenase family)
MDMTGKTVLLTGAAGGLGTTVCWAFAGAGATVYALDRDAEKGARLMAHGAEHAADAAGKVEFVQSDLGDLDSLRRRLDALFDAGGVDIVINNAAIYPSRPIEAYTLAEYQEVQRVNADSAVVCVQAALPHMKKRGWGRIVNVCSVTLYGGWANLMPYVASKGALLGMTRAMARELGADGITANAICPGAFPTDAEKIHPEPEKYNQYVLDHQAVKRRGTPQDIADAMLFLASDRAGFVTGQTLNVDGGWVMQ